jgi:hypothetical protein
MTAQGEIGGEVKNHRSLKTLKIFTRKYNRGRDEGASDRKEGMGVLNSDEKGPALAQGQIDSRISRIIDQFHQELFTG